MSDQDARPPTPRSALRSFVLPLAVRLALSVAAAAVVMLPVALERGIERTEIRDTIGLVPATLSLTGSFDSRLRLGILGTIRIPLSRGPIGVMVTADGAPVAPTGGGGLASYFSPQILQVYGGLFHDPGRAVAGYVDRLQDDYVHQVLVAELGYATLGGLLLAGGSLLLDPAVRRRVARHRVAATAMALTLGLTASTVLAVVEFAEWASGPSPTGTTLYRLPSLDGTKLQGAVTDSPLLQLAIEDAIPKVKKLIDRQESRTDTYVTGATAQLEAERAAMTGPRSGEVAVMMQSDMHCNAAMIALQRTVVRLLDQRYGAGTVGLLAISGDLTTNGTAAEGTCIEDEAAIAGDAPVAAVTGNHESDVSARQMKSAGMKVLTGSTEDVGDLKVLGDGDPNRTEMFGPTRPRGTATEQSVGEDVYASAGHDRPDLVLLHEAYAVQAFVGSGVDDMTTFLDGRGSPTRWWDDGIRDLPAAAVFYGHWHRSEVPRVVWNSDGTWTLVMELNTSGGAIASPTLNHFSTPWSTPQQDASFPVVFEDSSTHLVSGYQLYGFSPGGRVTVSPRVDVGTPDGRPALRR